ncbi:hypothetical protein RB608_13120 [Nocardioides sp. LHD-245]|uniref:hypothetical protein n=1 Tax=Nocardioides sp. LHD-245 TaxID=3051387 RepID=UPI0027E02880|nr:hypothetical protein [Nocardioides sp. LHD-245]
MRRRFLRRLGLARDAGERGAILVIALIIITVVAVVTGLVLTRGDGSLRATVALRNVAGSTYAADAAAQVVLNGLRTGYWDSSDDDPSVVPPAGWRFNNELSDGCFGYDSADVVSEDDALLLPDFYPPPKATGEAGTSAFVTCEPEDATGAQGTARHVTNANSPGDAIIMLGNDAGETGLYNFNKVLSVRGGIRVNSTIDAKGTIRVNDANVWARGQSCVNITLSSSTTATYTANCGTGTGPSDPDYPPDVTTIPPWRPVPACPAGGAYVEFQPGYYDDVKALTDLTTSCDKILWFRTGSYYFDFHNRSSNGDPLYESAAVPPSDANTDVWAIGNRKVIGGELPGGGTPTAATPIPGACENPIDDATSHGVQFVFGGDSSIYFDSDTKAELCATYRADRAPIVVYGLKNDNGQGANPSLTSLTGATGALVPTAVPTVTATGSDPTTFAPLTAAALRDQGNGVATWTRLGGGDNGNETRTVTMGGFAPPAEVPPGAVLKAARLLVRHKAASGANGFPASTVAITPTAPGSTALPAVSLSKPTSLTSQTIDLKATQPTVYDALAKSVHDRGYTGAAIAFTATANRNQSVQLDHVRLELEYYVPKLRGPATIPTNCVTTVGSGCYLINTHKKSEVYLQGTTYVPLGRIYLEVANTDFQVFRWGVIARSLYANLNGAYKETGALIELPDNTPGMGINGTLVQLKVYVCPASGSCSDDPDRLALKVRAQIWDKDGDPATSADREVTVLSWSHQH